MIKVQYSDGGNKAFFNGFSFRKDRKTGYYLCSKRTDIGKRERLHCYVWRYFNGEIPKGYHIHHKDENKSHNDIENLECVIMPAHLSYHGKERSILDRERVIKNIKENVIPKATEWHKSKVGMEWHKQHYEKMKGKPHIPTEYVCENCGKRFMAQKKGNVRYCSNACKSKARRESGVDNEERKCIICGNTFKASKYSKAQTCSAKCRSAICWDKRHKAQPKPTGLQYGG